MRRRHRAACLLALAIGIGATACSDDEPEPPPAPAPASPEEARTPSFDGVAIAYTAVGAGPGAVVLIHGWASDRTIWAAPIDDLKRDYRVVALDLAGHGASGRDRASWTLTSLARDVVAVVDRLDLDSVVLVGHSMGAAVALEAARRMPERTVGVVGVEAFEDLASPPAPARAETLAAWERDFAGTCAGTVRSMFSAGADPALAERVEAETCAAPPDVVVPLLRDALTFDVAAAARAARVPVRCINSDAVPTDVEANRRVVGDFDAVVLPGVGSFPMLERPAEFDAHLRRALEELTAGGV